MAEIELNPELSLDKSFPVITTHDIPVGPLEWERDD